MGALRGLRIRLGLRQRKPTDQWPWPGIELGRYTYGISHSSIEGYYYPLTRLKVGAFCSVGPDVTFFLGTDHHPAKATTFPAHLIDGADQRDLAIDPIVVGNDVWIGKRALIMGGVTIGDGAVIGAGSIVTRDIPPYAVAAGSPATVRRYRFAPDVIERLLATQWWTWPEDLLRARGELLRLSGSDFVQAVESQKLPPQSDRH